MEQGTNQDNNDSPETGKWTLISEKHLLQRDSLSFSTKHPFFGAAPQVGLT